MEMKMVDQVSSGTAAAPSIDLQPFCDNIGVGRDYLAKPFTRGDFTYATNGHIIIRVPRRDDVGSIKRDVKTERTFEKLFAKTFVSSPDANLPDAETERECEACDGEGCPNHCETCECECEPCGGRGWIGERASVSVNGGTFDAKYIRLILGLPGVELSATNSLDGAYPALSFRFDGGDGLLMGMSSPHEKHYGELFAPALAQ